MGFSILTLFDSIKQCFDQILELDQVLGIGFVSIWVDFGCVIWAEANGGDETGEGFLFFFF